MARSNRTATDTSTQGDNVDQTSTDAAAAGTDTSTDTSADTSADTGAATGDDTAGTDTSADTAGEVASAADAAATAAAPPPGMTAQEADDLSLTFGRVCVGVLRTQQGDAGAVAFVNAITRSTSPGSPERRAQDKAFRSLTRRFKQKL